MRQPRELLADILMCDVGSLPPPSTPLHDTAGWDSLRHVMLVLGLEQEFRVSLSAAEIQSMTTVADVLRVLKQKGIDG